MATHPHIRTQSYTGQTFFSVAPTGSDWGFISSRYWASNLQPPRYQSDSLTIWPWLPQKLTTKWC